MAHIPLGLSHLELLVRFLANICQFPFACLLAIIRWQLVFSLVFGFRPNVSKFKVLSFLVVF